MNQISPSPCATQQTSHRRLADVVRSCAERIHGPAICIKDRSIAKGNQDMSARTKKLTKRNRRSAWSMILLGGLMAIGVVVWGAIDVAHNLNYVLDLMHTFDILTLLRRIPFQLALLVFGLVVAVFAEVIRRRARAKLTATEPAAPVE